MKAHLILGARAKKDSQGTYTIVGAGIQQFGVQTLGAHTIGMVLFVRFEVGPDDLGKHRAVADIYDANQQLAFPHEQGATLDFEVRPGHRSLSGTISVVAALTPGEYELVVKVDGQRTAGLEFAVVLAR